MESKYIFALLGIFLAVFLGYWILQEILSPEESPGGDGAQLKVAATIYPLYDLVRNVAGDIAKVELILPPGASEHFYEFSPKQLTALRGTKIIFSIGQGLDDWVYRVKEALPGAEVYPIDKGIALRPGGIKDRRDPHYWLHFGNAGKITDNVTDIMIALDPEHWEIYKQNAALYKEALAQKEIELKARLKERRGQTLVTLHDAWYYFAENFELKVAGTFEPSAGEEPTPRYLAELIEAIRQNNVKIIFREAQFISAALEKFAQDNNLAIATLDPIGGAPGRDTFIGLMEYNVNAVLDSLRSLEQ